jgi:hypothetical protein
MFKKTISWPIELSTGACINPDSYIPYIEWLQQGNILQYTLEDAKLEKLASITEDRDLSLQSNVTAIGNTWQADSNSKNLLADAILMASVTGVLPPIWRTSDNKNIAITDISQLISIATAIATNVQNSYSTSWTRKQLLEEATTLEEVESI